MFLTEEEAKTKWCPFARCAERANGMASSEIAAGFNRNVVGEPATAALCIASACMAWRWGQKIWPYRRIHASNRDLTEKDAGGIVPDRPADVPPSWVWVWADPDEEIRAQWREPESEAAVRRTGVCGLAGVPHTE